MRKVILSTPLILEEGNFSMREITLEEARVFASSPDVTNFVGHSTVKVLGVEPANTREVCNGYDKALCLKVTGRIPPGQELSLEEILAIGVKFFLIEKN